MLTSSSTIPKFSSEEMERFRALPGMPVPGAPDTWVVSIGHDSEGHQINLVKLPPFGIIPNHTHTCASGMGITAGSAIATGKATSEIAVKPGDYVFKPAGQMHGFQAGEDGLEFISVSDGDGIVQEQWDIEYS